jgi:hypothetical protein
MTLNTSKAPFKIVTSALVAFFLIATPAFSQPRVTLQNEVRTEFLHAWNGYKQYAWVMMI